MRSEDITRYYEVAREEGRWDLFPRQNILEYIRARLKAGDSVLDVGCGTAEILNFFASGIRYVGLEKSEYALQGARKKWAERPLTEFISGEADSLPFSDDSFQAAMLLFSIEHVRNPRRILCECVRVLNRGGFLFIAAPNLEFPLAWPSALRHRSRFYHIWFILVRLVDYIRRLAGSYAFRVIKENFTDHTDRYERKDDDLRYVVSSWEVIRFLKKQGMSLDIFWEERPLSGWRRLVRFFPAMRWYGVTFAAVFKKDIYSPSPNTP